MAARSSSRSRKPPEGTLNGPVVLHAVVPKDLAWVNRGRFIVGGEVFPGTRHLMITWDLVQQEHYLLFCDANWKPVAGTSSKTLQDIKADAERFYPGLAAHWVDHDVDVATAEAFYSRLRAREGCSFCRRLAREHKSDHVFERGRVRVCGDCVQEFARELQSDRS